MPSLAPLASIAGHCGIRTRRHTRRRVTSGSMGNVGTIIDLSHVIADGIVTYPGCPAR